jgi:antitoxin component HigA of HigAB toxin-antitoxin module
MDVQLIHTPADHAAALKAVEALMNAEAGSLEGERLKALVTLIEAYERQHLDGEWPNPSGTGKFASE